MTRLPNDGIRALSLEAIDLTTNRRRLLQVTGAAGASLAVAGTLGRGFASAQEATPVPGPGEMPPLPEGASVLASGLINPRGVAVAEDGTVYVSESGTGGDEPLFIGLDQPVPEGTPAPDAEPAGFRGGSGQVTAVAPDGTVSVVATGLPSYAFGFETTGPAAVVFAAGKIWLAVGGAGPATPAVEALPNENSVVSIDPATGEVALVADLGAYEKANNPDPLAIDSNLYGLGLGGDGMLYAADAGGNTVFQIDPASGALSLVATLEPIPLPEGAEGPPMLEAVPTSVAANPAGGIFVGLLSGGPFPPGAAKVLAIAEDGTVSDAATSLTMVVDVAVGPDGNLYANQISTNFLAEIPAPGNVVRINADGSQEIVVDGLMFPNGIDFDAAGNLYVVAGAVSMGPPAGMLLRFDGVAATA